MIDNYFNIIIPTRNRLGTLRHSLNTALSQSYQSYKIIVSDNNSIDGTMEYVRSLSSEKVEYFNTGKSLSMSSNYEFAISKIKEGFVILIGDDDGLLPNALSDINFVINRDRVLAISSNTAVYYWPGASPHENLLIMPMMPVSSERRKSDIYINKVKDGELNYNELPMLYTGGVVHSSLIAAARNSDGRFYNSFTPDVYSGFALASVVGEYIRMEKPFAITGLSQYSNGQSQFGSNSDYSIAQTFFEDNDIPFFSILGNGRVKSLHLLTLEAYLQSGYLRLSDSIDLNRQFEMVIAKSSIKIRKDIVIYLMMHCNFSQIKFSKSWFLTFILIFKYFLLDNFERVRRFIFLDVIKLRNVVNNVSKVSEFIFNFHPTLFVKIKLKLYLILNIVWRRVCSLRI